MDWIQQWQSKLNKQNGVAPLVRTGGSRHTGLAALPYRNIQQLPQRKQTPLILKGFLAFCVLRACYKPPTFKHTWQLSQKTLFINFRFLRSLSRKGLFLIARLFCGLSRGYFHILTDPYPYPSIREKQS